MRSPHLTRDNIRFQIWLQALTCDKCEWKISQHYTFSYLRYIRESEGKKFLILKVSLLASEELTNKIFTSIHT